jgi:hypothetical protein
MVDSLGFRLKLGIIAPSTDTSVQLEMDAMRPYGITNQRHCLRMAPRQSSEHDLATTGQTVVIRSNFCAASSRQRLHAFHSRSNSSMIFYAHARKEMVTRTRAKLQGLGGLLQRVLSRLIVEQRECDLNDQGGRNSHDHAHHAKQERSREKAEYH